MNIDGKEINEEEDGLVHINDEESCILFDNTTPNNEYHPDNDQTHLITTGLAGEHDIKLKKKKRFPHFKNINKNEYGIDNINDYGYIEKWTITKSDNLLQMYNDAKRLKWGDLWPYPSPNINRFPSIRNHPGARKYHFKLLNWYRPKFREQWANFTRIFGKNHFKTQTIHGVVHEKRENL